MDQLICASLSYTQYWYEVDMFKVRNIAPHHYIMFVCSQIVSPKTSILCGESPQQSAAFDAMSYRFEISLDTP